MNSNKKIDNLLSSILFRLETLTNFSKEIKENTSKREIMWRSKIIKYILTTIATFILIVPTTFNINNILNAENSKTDYKISNLKTHIPTKFQADANIDHNDQKYEHNIAFSGNINVFRGRIKKLYFIYTKYDNNEIDEQAFHPITLSTKRTSLKTYIVKAIPYSNSFTSSLPLFTSKFDSDIFYHSSKSQVKKPVYILTIDNDNHFSLNILFMNSKTTTINTVHTDKSMATTFIPSQTKAHFKFMTSSQILDSQDYQKKDKLSISIEQFKKDTSQIQTIFRQYFSTN